MFAHSATTEPTPRRRPMAAGLALLTGLILLSPISPWPPICGSAAAQEDAGRKWELRNDRGNRYEGRREIPVARPDFELLSFLGHQEDYDRGVDLQVLFFLPVPPKGDKWDKDVSATVISQELRDEKQYWMRSKPESWQGGEWNQFGPWPTNEVLDREEIVAWDLGVYVELDSGEDLRLAPAVLYHDERPTSIEVHTLQLRPNQDLKRLEVTVTRAGDQAGEVLLEDQLIDEMQVGEPILLDLEASRLPEGWLRVEVVGSVRGRIDKAFFELLFFHRSEVS